jgi:hypothetical protein
MKKMISIFSFVLFSCLAYQSEAQVSIHLGVNIGSQPVWGPPGYDHVDYYYLPDIDAYYYIPQRRFIYLEGGRWIFAASLPPRYRDYDLYHSYKVVVNEPRPYLHADVYRTKYGGYRGRRDQPIIREQHEEKYWQIKEHPEHDKWKGDHGNNGRGRGNGKGHGHD